MVRTSSPRGVVLLAMGGPAQPREVRPFLEALFSDPALIQAPLGPFRRPLARAISHLRAPAAAQRYGLVGGSPLVEETRRQAAALATALAGDGVPVELAFSYCRPNAIDALAALGARGVRRVVALPMYPQLSHVTTGSAMRSLGEALAEHPTMEMAEVSSFPTLPGLVRPLAAQAAEALGVMQARGLDAAVLLTAHGLPERYLRRGDPYVDQVEETARAFRDAFGSAAPVALGYQSRLGPLRWVGPQVEDVVTDFARRGISALAVVPLTFLCEHLETLYDLDLVLRRHAWVRGMRAFARIPAIGCHPDFIADLAGLVRTAS